MKNLGYIDNIEDAVNARVKKAKELFGEYINRFSLSWTLPYLKIVDVILYEEYNKYIKKIEMN
jgi:uncharacterized protein (UPF0128 family)